MNTSKQEFGFYTAIVNGLKAEPAYLLIFAICALFSLNGIGSSIIGYIKNEVLLVIVGSGSFLVALVSAIIVVKHIEKKQEHPIKEESDSNDVITGFSIIDEIMKSYAENKFDKVISLSKNIGRSLYLEGLHKLRYEIGILMEDAASKLEDKESQVIALIDYIGWSLVLMKTDKQYEKALSNIKHGVNLSQENNNYFWASKGIRHIAGIHIMKEEYTEAKKISEASIEDAQKIKDEKNKNEMVAGIYYNIALSNLHLNDLNLANDFAKKAMNIFKNINDTSRICRIFSLLGKIAEANKNLPLAKDYFRQGLMTAEKLNRKDEIIRNHLGIARVAKDDNKQFAKKHLKIAQDLLSESDHFSLFGKEEIPTI